MNLRRQSLSTTPTYYIITTEQWSTCFELLNEHCFSLILFGMTSLQFILQFSLKCIRALAFEQILNSLILLLLTGSRPDRVQSTGNHLWHSGNFSNPGRTTLNPSRNTGLASSGRWCANCENLLNTDDQEKSLVKP